jgi:hypothetical protein
MPDETDSGLPPDFKKLLDDLFKDATSKNREALKEFLDLQKVVVEDYGKYVEDELAKDNEVLKHLVGILRDQALVVIRASRTHRTNVRAIHGRLVDAHLKFIDHLKDKLDEQVGIPKPPYAAKEPARPAARPRRKGTGNDR